MQQSDRLSARHLPNPAALRSAVGDRSHGAAAAEEAAAAEALGSAAARLNARVRRGEAAVSASAPHAANMDYRRIRWPHSPLIVVKSGGAANTDPRGVPSEERLRGPI